VAGRIRAADGSRAGAAALSTTSAGGPVALRAASADGAPTSRSFRAPRSAPSSTSTGSPRATGGRVVSRRGSRCALHDRQGQGRDRGQPAGPSWMRSTRDEKTKRGRQRWLYSIRVFDYEWANTKRRSIHAIRRRQAISGCPGIAQTDHVIAPFGTRAGERTSPSRPGRELCLPRRRRARLRPTFVVSSGPAPPSP
jgi:hypothetical protein